MSDATFLAKLPLVDSDEDMELVKLVPHGIPSSEGETSPTGREHPFSPMVNREMLLNIVKDAFQQTDEQQINFEATLKQEYSRRSKGEILAKELVGQLQVLDNNAHPFYKPRLFVTRNGYDLWLQGEKERVRKLIDKFWHCSLPRPQLWRNFNPIDYHRAFVILLQKVINTESRTDRKEPVHAGKTPSSPLSPTAKRLLTEFGLRYGVGILYQKIVYLEYLAKHFDYEIWYIRHCTEELRSIRNFLPRIRNQVTAVRHEMDILRSTIHLLHGQTDNSLTRIHRLFIESDPRKGVASLIELLAEVLDVEQNLFGKKVRSVKDWLIQYLKSGFVLRYERRKQIASAETVDAKTVQPFTLTPTLVNSLLLDTRDEVLGFRDKFQSVFRPYFDILPFSKVEFYRLICSDACCLCSAMINKAETRNTIPLEMLGLVYRLNERDLDWQNVIDPELQQWRQRFQTLACTWLDILGNQIQKWTLDAVEKDQWTLLVFDMYPQLRPSTFTSFSPSNAVDSMPSYMGSSWNHAATNPQIVSSIRISPFPSPPVSEIGQPTSSLKIRIGEGSGAFTPYNMFKRHFKTSPAISECSGGFTTADGSLSLRDTSSSTCFSITGDLPYNLKHQGKQWNGTAGSIVTFAQKKTSSGASKGLGRRGLNGGQVSMEPLNQIEVSVSVYSGSDEDRFSTISPLYLPSLDGDTNNTLLSLDQTSERDHTYHTKAELTNNTLLSLDQTSEVDHTYHTKAELSINAHDTTGASSTGTLTFTEHFQSLTNTGGVHAFVENNSTGQLAISKTHSGSGTEVGVGGAKVHVDGAGEDVGGADLDVGVETGGAEVDVGRAEVDVSGAEVDVGGETEVDVSGAEVDVGGETEVDVSGTEVDVGGETEVDVSGTEVDVGETEVDVSGAEVDVGGETEVDVSGTEVDVGEAKVDVSRAEVLVGGAKVDMSGTEVDVSRAEVDVSRAEVDVGGAEVDVGRVEVDVGEAKVDMSGTEMDVNRAEVDMGEAKVDVSRAKVDVGGAEVDVSRAEVDVSRAEVDVGGAEVDVSRAEVDVGEAKVGVSGAKVDVSRAEVDVGGAEVDVSRAEVDVGEAKVGVSGAKVDVSRAEVDVGESKVDVGGAKVDVSRAEVDVGGAKVDVGGVEVDVGEAKVDVSEAEVDMSGAEVDVTGAEVDVNRAEVDMSGTEVDVSGAEVAVSRAEVNMSGAEGNVSRAEVDVCGAKVDVSGAEVDVCGAKVDVSGAEVDVCGAKVDVSRAEVDVSGAEVDLGGTVMDVCGTEVDIGGTEVGVVSGIGVVASVGSGAGRLSLSVCLDQPSKFNSLLDRCNVDNSKTIHSKPRLHKSLSPISSRNTDGTKTAAITHATTSTTHVTTATTHVNTATTHATTATTHVTTATTHVTTATTHVTTATTHVTTATTHVTTATTYVTTAASATSEECPTSKRDDGPQPMDVPFLGSDAIASPIETFYQCASTGYGSDDTLKNQSTSNRVPSRVDGNKSMPRMTPPTPLPEEVEEGESFAVQSFLFPVSNSPLDLVTMLSRMAHFTGELLTILIPKISKTEYLCTDKLVPVNECAPEVSKARRRAYERQRCAEQLKTTFLKKLNKTMINSLTLYADNLLCMDLCCWSVHDAIKLIGLEHLNHLSRRRDCDEIWGCRHMVEANHGLHPGGIPCHKKAVEKFESVTRDMCIRINNIHILITIFHSLERHICNLVKTDSKRPISAFSYVSSDHSEVISNMMPLFSKTAKPAPCRTRYKPDSSAFPKTTADSNKGSSSWPSSVSNGLGPMEPDLERLEAGGKGKENNDASSKQSLECLQYLNNVQHYQVKMIAIRMNKFCKRALSELLGLKLGSCPIEKRLKPVVDYLDRHRVALHKYVYPECYKQIMENLWDYLLQDLEEEATKLRSSKRPITDKAQMLLCSLTHLIQFMHDRTEGLDIDILNSTSEYLQGLLDIMTRSTDHLIRIFNRLNTVTTLEQSFVSALVDSNFLQRLRSHLRYSKKCFTGAEFVSKVIEIGQGSLAGTLDGLDQERQQHSSQMFHPVNQSGNLVSYNEDYANTMACYLLEEGILIPVVLATTLDGSGSSTSLVTPNCVSDEEGMASALDSLHMRGTRADEDSNVERLVSHVREALSREGGVSSLEVPLSHEIYPATDTSSRHMSGREGSQHHHSHRGESRMNGNSSQYSDRLRFSATTDAYYKFAASEDAEYTSLLQSEILTASSVYLEGSHRQPCSTSTPQPENQDFLAAKRGTLYLVLDLLMQRARKERVVKQFLASPQTKAVQERRKLEDSINCDLIFKMS